MKLSRQFPLNALRVFESVARLGSFTRAGEEIGMTQTAVSYQIKLLEENIGEPLFLRRPRQIRLTDVGERLAPRVTEAFEMLNEAMADARQATEETLTIHSTGTFAQQWLSHHLGSFQLKHPNIAVRLKTGGTIVDFNRVPADLAVRWGTGNWPGLFCKKIMELDFSPMLSPKAAAEAGGIREPSDLLKLPIISAGDHWWPMWFKAAGIDDPGLDKFPRNELELQVMDANIAMSGQGVAILNPGHFADDVAAGRLYQPFDIMCNDGRDYWLVYPESRKNIPKIKAFRTWIVNEMDAEDL